MILINRNCCELIEIAMREVQEHTASVIRNPLPQHKITITYRINTLLLNVEGMEMAGRGDGPGETVGQRPAARSALSDYRAYKCNE